MNRRPSTTRHTGQVSGFTLVEMLVIISIIILLAGIAIPTVLNVRKQIAVKASYALINTLEAGCKAYKQDWGTYPLADSEEAWDDGHLAQDLLGHYGDDDNDGEPSENKRDDGVPGYGFRKRANGKKVGAYVDPDKVKIRRDQKDRVVFLDEFDNEVKYERYRPDKGGYDGKGSFRDENNNKVSYSRTQYASTEKNGGKLFRRDFILWTAGPDGREVPYWADHTTDDITNFLP
ncbi:MAG: hypothetical protein ACLFV7_00745 [Phycisphaerae bacterium]